MFTNGFSNKVVLYVPSTIDVSTELDKSTVKHYVDRTMRFLSQRFGGSTAQEAKGAWVAADGTLVIEAVTLVYAYAESLNGADYTAIRAYCDWLRHELSQEAIAAEINGKLYFI